MNRKREGELQKLQREVEELQMQNETQLGAFRKKHQEVQSEFADQLDQLNKLRQKLFLVSHLSLDDLCVFSPCQYVLVGINLSSSSAKPQTAYVPISVVSE